MLIKFSTDVLKGASGVRGATGAKGPKGPTVSINRLCCLIAICVSLQVLIQ